jgi:hypothetical protein
VVWWLVGSILEELAAFIFSVAVLSFFYLEVGGSGFL